MQPAVWLAFLTGVLAGNYIVANEDVYLLPKDKLTAEMIAGDQLFAEVRLADLPQKFWRRSSRSDLMRLAEKMDVLGMLGRIQQLGLVEENQFFTKEGELILFSDVLPGPTFRFTSVLDRFTESFSFATTDIDALKSFRTALMPKLRLAHVLADLTEEALYKISRYYFPDMESYIKDSGPRNLFMADLLKQSLHNLLKQLLKNEGAAFSALECQPLVDLIIHNKNNVAQAVLRTGASHPEGSLMHLAASKIYEAQYELGKEDPKAVLRMLLTSRHNPALIEDLVDKHGLAALGPDEWSMLASYHDYKPIKRVLLTGIVLGTVNAAHLEDPEYFGSVVQKLEYDQLSFTHDLERDPVMARPFSWIAVSSPHVVLPTKILRALTKNAVSSVEARECLLKHLAVDKEEQLLLPWFWKLFGSGKAAFALAPHHFKDLVIANSLELGYLAFPEMFDNRPPPLFRKATLMSLIKLGPVDGTIRSVNASLSRLIAQKMDALNEDDLRAVYEFARDSRLSYIIGTASRWPAQPDHCREPAACAGPGQGRASSAKEQPLWPGQGVARTASGARWRIRPGNVLCPVHLEPARLGCRGGAQAGALCRHDGRG